jgi:DNA polymerase I-like protein with 3'-5' exonuclease and polymerase domains
LVSTVHDSIVADSPSQEVETVREIFDNVFKELPSNIKKVYGIDWNVPMVGEVSVGPNMSDLT